MNKIELQTIDLITGRACEQMDQLPVAANSLNSRRYALVLAGAAFILAAVGLGVPSPRIGSNITNRIEVPSPRIS